MGNQAGRRSNSRIAAEVAQFDAVGGEWWDEQGPFKPLHMLNPVRMEYMVRQIAHHYSSPSERDSARGGEVRRGGNQFPQKQNLLLRHHTLSEPLPLSVAALLLRERRILDIACGGGLVCEPLARLGAQVTGIDTSTNAIAAASAHAAVQELKIDYQCCALEEFIETRNKKQETREKNLPSSCFLPLASQFDVITALEILEHVADPAAFVKAAVRLLKPGGLMIFSTINRTAKSLLLAKIAAEDILKIVPRGTHDWNKFVQPSELAAACEAAGLQVKNITGLALNPLRAGAAVFAVSQNISVNYFLTASIE